MNMYELIIKIIFCTAKKHGVNPGESSGDADSPVHMNIVVLVRPLVFVYHPSTVC